jgi:hypothetical protein
VNSRDHRVALHDDGGLQRMGEGTFAGTRERADCRPSCPRSGTGKFDPLETFITAPAEGGSALKRTFTSDFYT